MRQNSSGFTWAYALGCTAVLAVSWFLTTFWTSSWVWSTHVAPLVLAVCGAVCGGAGWLLRRRAARMPLAPPPAASLLPATVQDMLLGTSVAPAPVAVDVAPAAEKSPPPDAVDVRLRAGLQKTQQLFLARLNQLLQRTPQLDAALLQELETLLLSSDVGVGLTQRFLDSLSAPPPAARNAVSLRQALQAQLLQALQPPELTAPLLQPLGHVTQRPKVVLLVGINGVGKTTTLGKLATQLVQQGLHVCLVAGDTFRAAAAEQLQIWAERSGASLSRGAAGSDPASVVFNAVRQAAAAAASTDIVLVDTAGRLHTQVGLMDEVKKIQRAIAKARPTAPPARAPDETWLVVDATTGQNALQQAREFHQALGLTGLILTKLDGTAKGGVAIGIVDTLKIPIRFVGVGEQAADLRPFVPETFIAALFDDA